MLTKTVIAAAPLTVPGAKQKINDKPVMPRLNYTIFPQFISYSLQHERTTFQRDESMDMSNLLSTRSISLANYMDLTCDGQTTMLPDGTKMSCNDEGAIVFMHYASGIKLKRYSDFVICLNQFSELWFGDSRSAWYRLN